MYPLAVTLLTVLPLSFLAPASGQQGANVNLDRQHELIAEDLRANPQLRWDQHSLLIRWRAEVSTEQREVLRQDVGDGLLREYACVPDLEWIHVRGDLNQALQTLARHSVYVEPNHVVRVDLIPNDPRFDELYGLLNTGQQAGLVGADIHASQAWEITTGDPNQVIAILDTGMELNHQDLNGNLWTHPGEIPANGIDDDGNGFVDDLHGWDFFSNDNDPSDFHGHGTHVAGTIGAVGDNGIGVTGVNWSCRLMPLRFIGPQGGVVADAIAALDYCLQEGVLLSNNSWSGGGPSQALRDAIEAGQASGHIFVAAAGNFGFSLDVTPQYPASFDLPNLVSVGASNASDELASFSNWGPLSVDLIAPGVDILSTAPGNSYQFMTGTSMASPHVTGVLALMLAQTPGLGWQAAITRLRSTSRPLTDLIGAIGTAGVVNAQAALQPSGGPDAVAPTVPNGLSALPLGIDVRLRWNAVQDLDLSGYRVLRSDSVTGPGVLLVEGLIQGTEFNDPTGAYGRTVYYQVQAEDTSGNLSAASSQISVLVGGIAGRQTLINETFNDGFFAPEWDRGNTLASVAPDLGIGATPAAMLRRSTWIERSVNTRGFEQLRLEWSRATIRYDHGEELLISWSPNGGTTWVLLQARGNSPWSEERINLGSGANDNPALRLRFETTADGIEECTLLDNIKLSGEPIFGFGADHTPPREPRQLTVTGTVGAISLQWQANPEPDLAGYGVYRLDPGAAIPVLISPWPWTSTSFQDFQAHSNQTYRYSLRAIDLADNASGLSRSVEATTIPPATDTAPDAPINLQATVGHRRVDLTWDAVTEPDVAGYRVLRLNGLSWDPITNTLISGTSISDAGLVNGVTYSYVVTAVDLNGQQSLNSTLVEATPINPGPLEILQDGFESGNFIGWIAADSNAGVEQDTVNSGLYSAKLRRDTWIRRTIITTGFDTLRLEFASTTSNYGPGEELIVEVFDGTSWNLLDTITSTSWQIRSYNLSPAANNNANFAVRFTTNADSSNDAAYIDDVVLIGTQI